MFSPQERAGVRDALVDCARSDERISGAAITGSGAAGEEDRWSDIDLALCVASGGELDEVIRDWTGRMYDEHGAVHHVDVLWGTVLFRVFLLANTLQVDIAFWPAGQFGATESTFRLLFGTANDRAPTQGPGAEQLIGMGWLYALHARSSIARGRVWQAEYMISGVRDHVLALACIRHGLPTSEGRGMDRLPAEVTAAVTGALVRSLDLAELKRAFQVANEALVEEIAETEPGLVTRLAGPLQELADIR